MRTVMVVVVLPSLQFLTRILHRNELVDVQKLITQATVERLDEPVGAHVDPHRPVVSAQN